MSPLLNPDEAAEYLDVSRSTFDRLRPAPRHITVGRRKKYHVGDLDAWINRQRSAPRDESRTARLKAACTVRA